MNFIDFPFPQCMVLNVIRSRREQLYIFQIRDLFGLGKTTEAKEVLCRMENFGGDTVDIFVDVDVDLNVRVLMMKIFYEIVDCSRREFVCYKEDVFALFKGRICAVEFAHFEEVRERSVRDEGL